MRKNKGGNMDRLTERERNFNGTGISKESLIAEDGTLSCFCGEVVTKLADYEDMEEDGKLLKLPCKVNDIVYRLNKPGIKACLEKGMEVEKRKVAGFDIREFGVLVLLSGGIFSPDIIVRAEEFGKTVFLTEQEAKEALEGMKE